MFINEQDQSTCAGKKSTTLIPLCLTGQSEIERACDMLFEKAESIDYRYDVQDQTVEGLLILPLYGSMPTGKRIQTVDKNFFGQIFNI